MYSQAVSETILSQYYNNREQIIQQLAVMVLMSAMAQNLQQN